MFKNIFRVLCPVALIVVLVAVGIMVYAFRVESKGYGGNGGDNGGDPPAPPSPVPSVQAPSHSDPEPNDPCLNGRFMLMPDGDHRCIERKSERVKLVEVLRRIEVPDPEQAATIAAQAAEIERLTEALRRCNAFTVKELKGKK